MELHNRKIRIHGDLLSIVRDDTRSWSFSELFVFFYFTRDILDDMLFWISVFFFFNQIVRKSGFKT